MVCVVPLYILCLYRPYDDVIIFSFDGSGKVYKCKCLNKREGIMALLQTITVFRSNSSSV